MKPYPEDVLERKLSRFVPGPVNRFVATELVLLASAIRYLCGGFRRPAPRGFSYVRTWASLPLLLAVPVFVIPEMIAVDFVLWNAPWWRLLSDVLHVYGMLWVIGLVATARARPHRCDGDFVRLRFGCVRRLDLDRANIAAVAVRSRVTSEYAFKQSLRRAGDTIAMTLSGVPVVELTLRRPVAARSLFGRAREVRRVFVAADEPAEFAAALAA